MEGPQDQSDTDSPNDQASGGPEKRAPTLHGLGASCLTPKRNPPNAIEHAAHIERMLQQQKAAAQIWNARTQNDKQAPPSKTQKGNKRTTTSDADDDDTPSIASRPSPPKKKRRQPAKKRVNKSAKAPKAKPKASNKSRKPVKKSFGNGDFRLEDIFNSNFFGDAADDDGAPDQPIFDKTNVRAEALAQLVEACPPQHRDIAKKDARCLDKACKVYGPQQIKPDENGLWKVKGLKSTLRPHQVLGAAFLLQRERSHVEPRGGILADQMGLGKTVMALACIVRGQPMAKTEGKTTLIVTTAALVNQWFKEIEVHCEKSYPKLYTDYVRARMNKVNDPVALLEQHDILITTYNQVAMSFAQPIKPPDDEEEADEWFKKHYDTNVGPLHQIRFHRIILDESQSIRNSDARVYKACAALRAKNRICLTGTPCLNSVADLWAMLAFCKVPMDYTASGFKKRFDDPEKESSSRGELTTLLAQYLFRRTHVDRFFGAKLVTLPKHQVGSLKVYFNPIEKALYKIVETRYREQVIVLHKEGIAIQQYRSILLMILRLRMLTAHPLLLQDALHDCITPKDLEQLEALSEQEADRPDHYGADLIKTLRKELTEVYEESTDSRASTAPDAPPAKASSEVGIHDAGKRHGLFYKFQKYLDELKKGQQLASIEEAKRCVFCGMEASESHVTSCLHVYCGQCLKEVQEEAAENGLPGATCGNCDTMFDHAEPYTTDTLLLAKRRKTNFAKKAQLAFIRKKPKKSDADEDDDCRNWLRIGGDMLPSAKSLAIKAQILSWLQEKPDAKIVIYTQWVGMIQVLASVCAFERWGFCTYNGQMSQKARIACVEKFEEDKNIKIMIAGLQCGGLGLNLTVACRVIAVDPWWNSAVEEQAFARVYRMGQENETQMLRLTVVDTIDERMKEIKQEKLDKINAAVDENDSRKRLSLEELMKLFGQVDKNQEEAAQDIDIEGDDAPGTSKENAVFVAEYEDLDGDADAGGDEDI